MDTDKRLAFGETVERLFKKALQEQKQEREKEWNALLERIETARRNREEPRPRNPKGVELKAGETFDGEARFRALFSRPVTKEEILDHGTARERATLAMIHGDVTTFGGKPFLTKAEIDRLRLWRQQAPQEQVSEFLLYVHAFDALREVDNIVRQHYSAYQVEASKLALKVRERHDLEREAYNLSLLANTMKGEEKETFIRNATEKGLYNGYKLTPTTTDSGRLLLSFNIYEENGIYNKILERSKAVETRLGEFKGVILAVSDFLHELYFPVMPILYKHFIDLAETENYIKVMEVFSTYTKRGLRGMEEDGKEVLPIDRERAVFPDFYEVPMNKDKYNEIREKLNKYLVRMT